MGNPRIRTLLDMSIHGMNLKAECRWCGRWRVIDAGQLMWRYHKHGWSILLEDAGAHLRCAGCGRKDIWTSISYDEQTPAQPLRNPGGLRVVDDAPCPVGIDEKAWAKAGTRERQRLVRMNRG